MDVVLVGLGVLVLAVAFVDIALTTVALSSGKGPLTGHLARGIWWVFLSGTSRFQSRNVLALGGPVVLFSILFTWIGLLVVGWSLVLSGGEGVTTEDGAPVGVIGSVRFGANLVIGRGAADLRPGTSVEFLEPVVGASGLVLLSLSIAYVLPVVNAAVQKRQVASYISTLGHSAEEVLERAWNEEDFGFLHLHYIALGPLINELAERHLAYPVLHYFHSVERHTAIGPSIAVLDESLTLLECCIPEVQLAPSVTLPIRRSITEFLDTLREAFVTKADEPPSPPPRIGELRDRGIPVLGEDDVGRVFDEVDARRSLLLALVQHDAWSWDELPTSRRQVDEAIVEAGEPVPVPDEELDTSIPEEPAGE